MGGGGDSTLSFAVNPAYALTNGYALVTSRAEMLSLFGVTNFTLEETCGVTGLPCRVAGLFGYDNMPFEADGTNPYPHLSEMTIAALRMVENATNGFFLLIEGGNIDIACHMHSSMFIQEVIEFDRAFSVVTNWAAGRTDTLIVEATDHETGGLSVTNDNGAGNIPSMTWQSIAHTAEPVSVRGWGVNADMVTNISDNTQMFALLNSSILLPSRCLATGTDPFLVGTDGFQSTWDVYPGDVYRLDYAEDLVAGNWQFADVVTASTYTVTLTDTNAAWAGTRLYRLKAISAGP